MNEAPPATGEPPGDVITVPYRRTRSCPQPPCVVVIHAARHHHHSALVTVEDRPPVTKAARAALVHRLVAIRRPLAHLRDKAGRTALDVADAVCKAEMRRARRFFGRYEVDCGEPAHRSETCVVVFATDFGPPKASCGSRRGGSDRGAADDASSEEETESGDDASSSGKGAGLNQKKAGKWPRCFLISILLDRAFLLYKHRRSNFPRRLYSRSCLPYDTHCRRYLHITVSLSSRTHSGWSL